MGPGEDPLVDAAGIDRERLVLDGAAVLDRAAKESAGDDERDMEQQRARELVFDTRLAKSSKPSYIIVRCGNEGLEGLLWVGENREEAIGFTKGARKMYGDEVCVMLPRKDPDSDEDTYSIGCVCGDLGLGIDGHWSY